MHAIRKVILFSMFHMPVCNVMVILFVYSPHSFLDVKACASMQEDYLPKVTFVVVQKRHHTRLFPVGRGNRDKSGNILPG
jgi:hypothetical protein